MNRGVTQPLHALLSHARGPFGLVGAKGGPTVGGVGVGQTTQERGVLGRHPGFPFGLNDSLLLEPRRRR
ncbi:hypothetical protein, partial [Nocardia cyriacigeorgica]|uniref:hypothetical protein n=1 Tax=Nocardia cyriacigeorgica TaxID=135487 RepID=UPI001E652BC5